MGCIIACIFSLPKETDQNHGMFPQNVIGLEDFLELPQRQQSFSFCIDAPAC